MTRTIELFDRGLVNLAIAIENSRRARAAAHQSCTDAAATSARVRETQAQALDATTTAVDGSPHANSMMAGRLDRLSRQVGRSPAIEQAKKRLAEQYGISPGEAFHVLGAISNNSNRKLRDVAAELLNAR